MQAGTLPSRRPPPAPTVSPTPNRQRIEIKGRAFQQPRREPLGDDWAAELRQLQGARQATADAIHRTARSDPTGLRAKVAECGRMLASLPEGEAEQARQEVESLHAKLALVADGVALRPTKQRSGKQQRRRGQRDDSDKLTRPLQPGRRSQAGKRKLQAALTTDVVSDTLPRLRQKLEDSKKVRVVGCTCGGGLWEQRAVGTPAP